jgi:hypothetical protein
MTTNNTEMSPTAQALAAASAARDVALIEADAAIGTPAEAAADLRYANAQIAYNEAAAAHRAARIANGDMSATPATPAVDWTSAKYAVERLVTDTLTYDVVKRTAKTITLRPRAATGEIVRREDYSGNGYPQIWEKTESIPEAGTHTLRLRKDGTFRRFNWSGPLRFTNDEPTKYTDYRM